MVSLREEERKRYCITVISILKESNMNYERALELIEEKIRQFKEMIKKLNEMSDEEFHRMVSQSIFGVAMKGYYEEKYKKRIKELELIKGDIKVLFRIKEGIAEEYEIAWLKDKFKGFLKELKELGIDYERGTVLRGVKRLGVFVSEEKENNTCW